MLPPPPSSRPLGVRPQFQGPAPSPNPLGCGSPRPWVRSPLSPAQRLGCSGPPHDRPGLGERPQPREDPLAHVPTRHKARTRTGPLPPACPGSLPPFHRLSLPDTGHTLLPQRLQLFTPRLPLLRSSLLPHAWSHSGGAHLLAPPKPATPVILGHAPALSATSWSVVSCPQPGELGCPDLPV